MMARGGVRALFRQACAGWWALAALVVTLWLFAPPVSAQEAEPAPEAAEAGAEPSSGPDEAEPGEEEHAEEDDHGEPHYPLETPDRRSWSFAGPFGTYETAQLQRGLDVYLSACAGCHGIERVAFRTLTSETGPYLSEEQMRAIAETYTIVDEVTGERRPGRPSDYFPGSNVLNAPDLSLMAKARAVGEGFRWMIDAFTQYQEAGPNYIHALLTGYEEPPAGTEIGQGLFYNPYFVSGVALAMPPPLRSDGQISYDDGTPETVEQYAEDVAAFLMWTAEPKLNDRKSLGFQVMIFLIVFAVLTYLAKRTVWRKEH